MRNTSVTLGNYFDDFIKSLISKGRYKNASEVIRAGLRLLEDEENKAAVLKDALIEGLNSGIAHDFDAKGHLAKLKLERNSNA